MNTGLVDWVAPLPRRPAGNLAIVPMAAVEARRRPLLLAGVFAAVALTALLIGLVLPEKYTSTMTIRVAESGLAAEVLGDSGSSPAVRPHAAAAREIALSRPVMQDILATGGWLEDDPTPVEQERLASRISQRLLVDSPRLLPNLVQVSYTDDDPERAQRITRRFGELIMQETLGAKARESREVYGFIDAQARQYHAKLLDAQERLHAFRVANPDAREGSAQEASRRVEELRRAVDLARLDLVNASAQAGMASSQLAQESPLGPMQSRSNQLRVRLAELQSQLDGLLLSYTEQHPDVAQVRAQMRDVEAQLRSAADEPSMRLALPAASDTGTAGTSLHNPVYNDLRSRVADARTRSAASASRVALGRGLLGEEQARTERIAAAEGTLAELMRELQLHQDVYADLLRRREDARVALNLATDEQQLGLTVQAPAARPLQPDAGLRLMHVAAAGLVLASAAPILLLLGWMKVDPRVRTPRQVEQLAGLPVLGAIPLQATPALRRQRRTHYRVAAALVLSVPLLYGLALYARMAASP